MACVAIAVFASTVCLITYFAVRNGIIGPLAAMVHAMREVADQKYGAPIPDSAAPMKSASSLARSKSSRRRGSSGSA